MAQNLVSVPPIKNITTNIMRNDYKLVNCPDCRVGIDEPCEDPQHGRMEDAFHMSRVVSYKMRLIPQRRKAVN